MHLILEELSECLAGESDFEDECIVKELPEDCDLYGNINHTGKETPQNDCEFVSVFWAEGQIYTTKDKNCIYLKLTTGWLDNAVVKFDLVKTKDGH